MHAPRTTLTTDADNYIELVTANFVGEALEREYRFYASRRIRLRPDVRARDVAGVLGDVRWWARCTNCAPDDLVCDGFLRDREEEAIVRLDNEHDGELVVAVASPEEETTTAVLDRWVAALAAPDDAAPNEVKLAFATAGQHHAYGMRTRAIEAPSWEEIRGNYVRTVAEELERLCAYRPDGRGRLLLWRGAPGTGKTHAVRALIRAWSSWCRPIYISDPEQFFGGAQDYMLDMLIGREDRERPWQLLILEDAGELIAVDARETAGQALSRLLNVSDGLIGQSTNTLVLVTTNEDIGRLHPAVHRAGRCISDLEFTPLPADDAARWLAVRNHRGAPERAIALAELYAMLDERHRPDVPPDFGFRP